MKLLSKSARFKIFVYIMLHKIKLNKVVYWCLMPFCKESKSLSFSDARAYLRMDTRKHWTEIKKRNIKDSVYDLTIIIPTFNSEKTIRKCLDSICNPISQYTVQIIVVDDGSTDHTGTIVQDYKNISSLNYIFHHNQGVAISRNVGLDHAKGVYVMFVDSDDILVEGAIEKLIESAYAENADIVEGSYYRVVRHKRQLVEHYKNDFCSPILSMWGVPWAKVIRRDLFEHLSFPEHFIYEDTVISFILYSLVQKAVTISNPVYEYVTNRNSITFNAYKNGAVLDTFYVFHDILEHLHEYGVLPSQELYELSLKQLILNQQRLAVANKELQRSVFILSIDLIERTFKNFSSQDKIGRKIERFIADKDFSGFRIYCLYFIEKWGLMWIKT